MSQIHIPLFITLFGMHLRTISPNIHKYLERFASYKKIDAILNMKSRKSRLLLAIIVLATIGTFIPPLVCWLMSIITGHTVQPLVILTDGDWITVISIIVPAYMGFLTWEKHIALSNNVQPGQLDGVCDQIINPQGSQLNNGQLVTVQVSQQQDTDADKEAFKDALKHGS